MKILTASQMSKAEEECAGIGISTSQLMENAAKAVAEEVKHILDDIDQQRILVLVGPGNNGGDGLVAARYLHDWGAEISVFLLNERAPDDPNLKLILKSGVTCVSIAKDADLNKFDELLASADAVIDAIFGTGRSRPLQGVFKQVLDKVSLVKMERQELHIFALDMPSGLDSDTGEADSACIYADDTITLGFAKPGLFNSPGAGKAGRITVVDIGIPEHLAEQAREELLGDGWARAVLPRRPIEANKGDFGRVLVVAGSINYIGAAYLACEGAMRVGAGLVTLAVTSSLQPILASKLTEVTYLPLPESRHGVVSPDAVKVIYQELDRYHVLLLGCGLGQSESVIKFINAILLGSRRGLPPLVLDADALNALARIPQWWKRLDTNAILTPHPGEMSRLAGTSIDKIQSNRADIATALADEWHKTIVLKGAYTVIAAPGEQPRISPFASPGLASAGTGDVLAGAIAGLVAQGLSLGDAAACGVYLHGKAGEVVESELGDAGMMATDLLPALPLVIKQIKKRR